MVNQFCSPSFIIDPNKKDAFVQIGWSVGDIKFSSKVTLFMNNINIRFLQFEVKATRPEKVSSEPFSYVFGLQICENQRFLPVHYNFHRLLNSFESFFGGIPFNHTIPREFKLYVVKYKDIVSNENQSMIKTGINPQSTDGYIQKLWREKLFTDFVFKVKEQEFPVHKSILAAQSDVFRVMFTYERKTEDNIANTAEISDISPEAFHQFLEYLYIRTHPTHHILDVYKAAYNYDIKELMNICERIIIENTSQGNVVKVLKFANIFDIKEMRESAFKVLQNKIFPEKVLPENLKHNVKLVERIIKAKQVYEKALLEVTKSSK